MTVAAPWWCRRTRSRRRRAKPTWSRSSASATAVRASTSTPRRRSRRPSSSGSRAAASACWTRPRRSPPRRYGAPVRSPCRSAAWSPRCVWSRIRTRCGRIAAVYRLCLAAQDAVSRAAAAGHAGDRAPLARARHRAERRRPADRVRWRPAHREPYRAGGRSDRGGRRHHGGGGRPRARRPRRAGGRILGRERAHVGRRRGCRRWLPPSTRSARCSAEVAAQLRPGAVPSALFRTIAEGIGERLPGAVFPHHAGHGVGVTGFEPPHLIPGSRRATRRRNRRLGRTRRLLRRPVRGALREPLPDHRGRRDRAHRASPKETSDARTRRARRARDRRRRRSGRARCAGGWRTSAPTSRSPTCRPRATSPNRSPTRSARPAGAPCRSPRTCTSSSDCRRMVQETVDATGRGRHPDGQRGHRQRGGARLGGARGVLGSGARRLPQGRVADHAVDGSPHDRAWSRAHRHHLIAERAARRDLLLPVHRRQARRASDT